MTVDYVADRPGVTFLASTTGRELQLDSKCQCSNPGLEQESALAFTCRSNIIIGIQDG
jgi:hypothetical protein